MPLWHVIIVSQSCMIMRLIACIFHGNLHCNIFAGCMGLLACGGFYLAGGGFMLYFQLSFQKNFYILTSCLQDY